MEDVKYRLALATLDAFIGICFAELQAAQNEVDIDAEKVGRLKLKFEDCCVRRDGLRDADENARQALIDDLAPRVRASVEAQRELQRQL